MSHRQTVEEIVFDPQLSVPEKSERIIAYFAQQSGRGMAAAVECLIQTKDDRVSSFAATYLQMIPGGREEKTMAAERLRAAGPPLVRSAARLVPWLPGDLLDGFVADYLADPEPNSPRSSVLFNIAVYEPERLRPYADRIESDSIQRSLLSGAPDVLVDAFLESWREDEDIDTLHALALIRTEHAADVIQSLREEIEEPEDWEALIELAGRLPETGASSGYRPSFMGFVVDTHESDHVMGGTYPGDVPLCPLCEAPAERVLTIAADSVPFDLSQDPSFFWYSCDCRALDSTTVRIGGSGRTVYFGPQGPARSGSTLVPGERSMALEPHPNQTGVSLEAIPGQFLHQVGGLPNWSEADLHPVCPECGKSMPFLASIDSGHTPFGPMGFNGTLYGFWCDGCHVSSTKFQS
ncbi:hypothetical protein [Streptomyces sp. NPDC029004]|uniref:hypothetical protein n=1 Tax=Streptomyces sp. NPDC029004 TaxID=3154490 RepID=UPI0033EC49C8